MACFATPYGLRYAAHCFNRADAQNNRPALIPAGGKLGVTSPSLERALHSEFEAARVNAQNFRKEFFRVTLDEIEAALQRLAPDAPFFKDIEAQEYHETLSRRRVALEAKLETQGFPASL